MKVFLFARFETYFIYRTPAVKMEVIDFKVEKQEDEDDEDFSVAEPLNKSAAGTKKPKNPKPVKRKRIRDRRKPRPPPVCCMCLVEFPSESELLVHCEAQHPNGKSPNWVITCRHKYQCPYCRRKFRLMRFLTEHYRDLNYTEPYYDRSKDMEKLRKYKAKQSKEVCPVCGLQLFDKKCLDIHLATKHSTERKFVCDYESCKQKFGHEVLLMRHIKTCHTEKRFICDICLKRFAGRGDVRRHISVHLPPDQRPFRCDKCLKTFSLESTLKSHVLASHSGVD